MNIEFLNKGINTNLIEVLDRKEKRQEIIDKLSSRYKDCSVLIFTLNIPGPIKNNDKLDELFNYGKKQIKYKLKKIGSKCIYQKDYILITGPEMFLVIQGDCKELKKEMVYLEDSEIGRIFDIDIFSKGKFISRTDLNIEERKCFICNKPAKICARSRAHTVNEMLIYIEKIMKKYL